MTLRASAPLKEGAKLGDARTRAGTFAFVALVLVLQLLLLRDVPFFSEDWTQMAEMRAVPTLMGALDPRLEPLRPLQHATFWVIAHAGGDPTGHALPMLAHALALALQAASCACVYALARAAGISRFGAFASVALFAVFPNVKTLAWTAAIGSAGRVCFELLALLLFVRHARQPSASRAALGLCAFFVALAFHESAMLLPVVLVAWIVFVHDDHGEARTRLRAAAHDPWLRALALIAVVYAVLLVLRPQRHHELKSLASLPANVAKAMTALMPEAARTLIVDGFRGRADAAGFIAAGLACLASAGFVYVVLRRSPLARFVAAACAADLGLAVLGAGFVQRYAYFSSALLAIGLGAWFGSRPEWRRAVPLLALAAWWSCDTLSDVHDLRDIGRQQSELVDSARRGRSAAGAGVPIAVLDPDDMTGAEHDIPLFNWGLDFMLEARGVAGPVWLWRTRDFATSTSVELVDRERAAEARRAGSPFVVEASDAARRGMSR